MSSSQVLNQDREVELEKSAISAARSILDGLDCVKGESKKGRSISRSFVRNLLEISMQVKTEDEFFIRMDYIIARQEPKSGAAILTFRKRFNNHFKDIKKRFADVRTTDILRKMMEYIVMSHTAKTNIPE